MSVRFSMVLVCLQTLLLLFGFCHVNHYIHFARSIYRDFANHYCCLYGAMDRFVSGLSFFFLPFVFVIYAFVSLVLFDHLVSDIYCVHSGFHIGAVI